jgi:hypothetical protein
MLKGLSKKEINGLKDFIPVYNLLHDDKKHSTAGYDIITELYKILKKEYPEFSQLNLSKEVIYSKLFKGTKFNESRLNNVKYSFMKILEYYYSFIDIQQEPIHNKMHIINQLEKRQIDDLMEINIHSSMKMMDQSELMDEDYYLYRSLLVNKTRLVKQKISYLGKFESIFGILNEEINYTTNMFLITMLKQLSLINNIKTHINFNPETKFYDYVYSYLKEHKQALIKNEILWILFKYISFYKEPFDKKDIIEIKILLNKNEKHFKKIDSNFLYIDLLSFCINKYNNGEKEYEDIILQLTKECINKEVHLQGGFIHEHNYTANVSKLIRFKELDTAETYINAYKDKLVPEHRENAYAYNYAIFHYVKKNYEKALEWLSKVKSKDFYYLTGMNDLKLKIYYEMNYVEAAFYLIDTYKHFFNKNERITTANKIRHQNFLKHYEMLLKIKNNESDLSPDEFVNNLSKIKDVEFKGWLIKRADEI